MLRMVSLGLLVAEGNETNQEDENNQVEDITRERVEKAINKIKIELASGEDKIQPEMIKWMGEKGREWLWRICNETCKKKNGKTIHWFQSIKREIN